VTSLNFIFFLGQPTSATPLINYATSPQNECSSYWNQDDALHSTNDIITTNVCNVVFLTTLSEKAIV